MKWDLTYLFKTEEEFEQAFNELGAYASLFASYKGKLGDKESFLAYLDLLEKFECELSRVYQYAHLRSDLNKKDIAAAASVQKCMMLLAGIQQATSFEEPEILSVGYEKVMSFIDSSKKHEQFRFSMEKLFRKNGHVLDEKREQILANFSELSGTGSELYSSLSVADSKVEYIKLNGVKTPVTQGNWRGLIADSTSAKDRKKIFEAIYKFYDDHKNAYANIYQAVLKADKANADSRNYSSILESHLFRNNIPTSVYTNLVEVASTKNASLKKYIKLRKKYLGLSRHNTYDRFLELAHSNKKYTYEEAKEIFFEAIKNTPADFREKAHEVLKDGFVDVYEQDGKRSGAYSSSMPNLHPYILLNYSDTLDDVFTVAHEAGHSIHSMYASSAQPTMLQDYTIFVAEIASTFNEHLLLDYFIASGNATIDEKIMLLQKAIDEIYSTFYRQTLFAEYELRASQLVEQNKPINHEVLSNIMIDLYKQYYGLDITKEGLKKYVWAYIPHLFYTPFYVYQYATSFAASFALYKQVKAGGVDAFNNYTKLLKSGGSKYPVEQALEAGVDFTKTDAFLAVVERIDELVAELEKVLFEKYGY